MAPARQPARRAHRMRPSCMVAPASPSVHQRTMRAVARRVRLVTRAAPHAAAREQARARAAQPTLLISSVGRARARAATSRVRRRAPKSTNAPPALTTASTSADAPTRPARSPAPARLATLAMASRAQTLTNAPITLISAARARRAPIPLVLIMRSGAARTPARARQPATGAMASIAQMSTSARSRRKRMW